MQERSSVIELANQLRNELDRYSPGGKLPSSRTLVERFRVSPVTVSRALAQLAAEGLVVTRPGAGAFRARPRTTAAPAGDTSWQEVALSADGGAELVPRSVDASGVLATLAAPSPGVVEFNSGYLHPSLQPERAMAAALSRAGRRPGAWGRPPMEGLTELREWFARGIGGAVTAAEVLVTAGGQAALTTALRALAPPGAPVLVESPTYPGMLAICRAAGQRPVPVPVDADGVKPALLADAFRASGARVFICQPLFQNPTGAVLAPERRIEVLRIAREAGAFVVEDDYVRRLVHEDAGPLPRPLAADDPDGVVVHVGSLTKATSPSFRVSALAARGPVLERLRAIQVVDTFFVPRPLQEAALELVGSPAWPRHLRAVSAQLRARRDAMTAALRIHLPELALPHVPSGGYHLWLRLPDGGDDAALTAAALRAGVAIAPGRAHPAELRGGRRDRRDHRGSTAATHRLRRGTGPAPGDRIAGITGRRRCSPPATIPAMTETPDLPEGYEISADPERIDAGRVHRWLSTDAYWALGRSREKHDRAAAGSLNFGVYDTVSGDQVAYARVVTDRATFAYLCDVYVDPAVRGKGLGTALVAAVRDHLRPFGLRRIVLATHDAHGVYAGLGFTPLNRPDRWMAIESG